MYLKAMRAGRLFVSFDENGHPLDRERVSRHLTGIEEFLKVFTETYPEKPLVPSRIP